MFYSSSYDIMLCGKIILMISLSLLMKLFRDHFQVLNSLPRRYLQIQGDTRETGGFETARTPSVARVEL